MEEQRNECLSQRKFGFAKFVWEIENYFCEAYKKKWEIFSPEFSVNGFLSIKWRFILKASIVENDAEYVAAIYLERPVTGNITIPVRVFWNLSCSFDGENITICEKEGVFEGQGSISSGIRNFNKLQEKLQDIFTRKLNIETTFLVTSLKDNAAYGRSNDMGLRSLSQDLCVLYSLKDYHDLEVKTGSTSVRGHKAILSAGNKLLSDIIHQYSGYKEISLAYSDEKSAGKIYSYLYTGNLDYILRTPSISIDEAITYFGVKELEEFYMKDELILRTQYEGREFYYKWIIKDIKKSEDSDKRKSFVSPVFGDEGLNITFRLCLKEISIPGDRMGIFLEGSFPQHIQELYITFDIINIYGDALNLKKTVKWSPKDGGPSGIEDFISKYILEEASVTANIALSILCSIFVPAGSTALSVVSNRSCLLSNINIEEHYTLFSKRIESLLDTGNHSDLTIRCGNERFQVHKCILSARSQVFAEAIRGLEEGSAVFSIRDVDPDILKIVLRYIYSGVLNKGETADLHKIYAAAVEFGVLTLKNQSAKILVENLDILNVFDSLFLAYAHRDVKLKLAAFKYLMYNRSEIPDRDTWEKFIIKRDLYEEFKDYVRKHVRNNPDVGLKLDDF